jgi:7-cyano-7-deazaguanine synthase in queuosine biosynthesis
MGRNVVVWSGGVDSTYTLNWLAGTSSRDYPVVAVSVTKYPQINEMQMMLQNRAQKEYLKFAKKKGFHIEHQRISVSGNLVFHYEGGEAMAQPIAWLSSVMPCLKKEDNVYFAYIRNDCFWHNRHKFEKVFDAICEMKGIEAKLKYPFEWTHKAQILGRLKKAKVPDRCWHSCDKPVNNKACGKCSKCKSIIEAKKSELYVKEFIKTVDK